LSSAGRWLAGAGLTAVFGYLIATVAVGGRHPVWPYFLFGAMMVLGIGLHFTGRRSGGIRVPGLGSFPPRSGPSSPLRPRGQFTSLRDGSSVDHQELVSGVVTDFPADTQPWILVRPVQAPDYWPQRELLLDKDGGFRAVVYFGQSARKNVGEEFILLLALATPPVRTQFQAFLRAPGSALQELPQDLEILHQLTVRRR
jgi:hypothetical protein